MIDFDKYKTMIFRCKACGATIDVKRNGKNETIVFHNCNETMISFVEVCGISLLDYGIDIDVLKTDDFYKNKWKFSN